jgi:hypothetical protein
MRGTANLKDAKNYLSSVNFEIPRWYLRGYLDTRKVQFPPTRFLDDKLGELVWVFGWFVA